MKSKWTVYILAVALSWLAGGFAFYHFRDPGRPLNTYFIFRSKRKTQEIKNPNALPDFTVLDHNGSIHGLYRNSDSRAIVYVGHTLGCKAWRTDRKRLRSLEHAFAPKGVTFFLVNRGDGRADLIADAKKEEADTPVLLDTSGLIGDELHVEGAGTAVIVDPATWSIVYRGPLDSKFEAALSEFLANGERARTLSQGPALCPFAPQPDPASSVQYSYQRDIVPILKKRCMNCHAKEARFTPTFDSYDSLKRWAAMIRETVMTERMPPFSADTFYGHFKNDISLDPEQKRALVKWVDDGLPREPGRDPLVKFKLPNRMARFAQFHKVIYSVSMDHAAEIPPQGTPEYQYFQLGDAVPRDLWVTAIETTTTSPRQLHHESLMVVPKPLKFFERRVEPQEAEIHANGMGMDGDVPIYVYKAIRRFVRFYKDTNYVRYQTWSAGRRQPFLMGKAKAIHIPKGSYLILETHYMGIGKPDTEQTTLNFYGSYAPEGRKPLHGIMLGNIDFAVPPRVKNFVVESKPVKFKRPIELTAFLPHMHMRGKAAKLIATDEKGESRILLSIPNFYYGWQTGSGLNPDPPIRVPAGTVLKAICEYDNSPQNPNNPDPNKTVHFGQTIDRTEMCHLNVAYTYAD